MVISDPFSTTEIDEYKVASKDSTDILRVLH
jgi:hypothetical protein